ncbi:MAG: DUF2116 family Zn-ribbon domain-containing protein [Thaumarchaeota archaeon]|nr:DUF2116 family Zn-ribbon domain-containing protein [Nitrososphaerota archaeon]
MIDHRHCRICGKAIPPGREFCSDECENVHRRAEARQKRMRNILLILYVVVFLSIFMMLALRGMMG